MCFLLLDQGCQLGWVKVTQPMSWVGLGLSFWPNLNFCFFEAAFWRKIAFFWRKIVICHPKKSHFIFKIPICKCICLTVKLWLNKTDNMKPCIQILGKITQVGSGWVKIRKKLAQVGSSWVRLGQKSQNPGWVGSGKMTQLTTLPGRGPGDHKYTQMPHGSWVKRVP